MRFSRTRTIAVLLAAISLLAAAWIDASAQDRREELRSKLKQRAQTRNTSETELHEFEHAGQKRSFRLHVPKTLPRNQAVPLMIALHGFGSDAVGMEVMTGFDEVAQKEKFVVAYPNAVSRTWRFWENLGPGEDKQPAKGSVDDVGFIAALIDQLVESGLVDRSRVYVTGISNGGFMSHRLGYSLSHKIAAIAPVAATLPKAMTDVAKPPRPLPVMSIHGTEDKIVSPSGADFMTKKETCLSAHEMAAWWAKHNGCNLMPQVQQLPDKASDGTAIQRHQFKCVAKSAPVVFLEVTGGGHTWPGGNFLPEFLLGKTSRDINASEEIWKFCAEQKLPR